MPDPTIRFAAGSPEQPRSAVWRLWVHRSDAYLGARSILGAVKFSMHESGDWIAALTSESGRVLEQTGSRRFDTWKRPPEFAAGWTQGPSVAIPWVAWRHELPIDEELPTGTEWVPAPKRNKMLYFTVLFRGEGVASHVESVLRRGDRYVTEPLPLRNGEEIWLAIRQSEMKPEEAGDVAETDRMFRGWGVSSLDGVGGFGISIGTGKGNGLPVLMQIPLGRRHFILKSE